MLLPHIQRHRVPLYIFMVPGVSRNYGSFSAFLYHEPSPGWRLRRASQALQFTGERQRKNRRSCHYRDAGESGDGSAILDFSEANIDWSRARCASAHDALPSLAHRSGGKCRQQVIRPPHLLPSPWPLHMSIYMSGNDAFERSHGYRKSMPAAADERGTASVDGPREVISRISSLDTFMSHSAIGASSHL